MLKKNIYQLELLVGDIILTAIDNNLQVESLIFPENACMDIGMPDDLIKAVSDIGLV